MSVETANAVTRPAFARPQGFSVALLALIACQVGLHACMQGARIATPLQVLRDGYGAWSVGVLMALFALFPALLAIPAGRMADRDGYHRPARIAAGLSLAGALVGAASGHFAALCVTAAFCGAGSGFGMIAMQRTAGRMAADATARIRIFSWVALAPAVAGLLGPMLAGALIDMAGFRIAFAALAALPAATLLIMLAVPTETRRAAPARSDAKRPAWDLLRLPSFRRLLFVNWLVSVSWDVVGFALPILGHERGMSASALGGVLAAYAVASMAVRLLIPLIAHRLSRRVMLAGGLLLTGVVFAVFPLLQQASGMALCAAMLGLALGTIQPAILSTLHDVAPPDRHGEALGLRSTTVHLSMATMPLLLGVAGAAIGAGALFWLMAGALGVGSWQARRVMNGE